MRMHLKNNKKRSKKNRIILLIILFPLLGYLFYTISANISYFYLNYSLREARQIIDNSIDSALTDEVLSSIKDKELFTVSKNDNNEIEMIDYDTYLVNNFLKNVTDNVANTLQREEKNTDRVAFYIPLGAITKNPIFNSRGPKIPVKMEVVGSVLTGIKTEVKEYGINNCLIEMVVTIEVTEKVILPMITDNITVVNEIPVSYKIITGKIPTYYGGSLSKNSSLYTIPME